MNNPLTLQEITPEWLTDALRSTNIITNNRVRSVAVEPLAAGHGFTSQLAKVKVDYSQFQVGAPRTLFCKLQAINQKVLVAAKNLGIYQREIWFYREMSDRIPIRTPRCYFSQLDANTGNFSLILEDLSPARPGDQLAGCSLSEAELAVTSAALLHAKWWNNPGLGQYSWLVSWDRDADYLQQSYELSWAKVSTTWGSQIPPRIVDLCHRMGPRIASIRNRLVELPQTLVHGDYRLDNCMFGTLDNDFDLAVVDWQACHTGKGMSDVAHFLAGALEPEIRRGNENNLLQVYFNTLIANGVTGYSFERCLYDYRLSLLDRLWRTMFSVAFLDFSSERGRTLVETWFTRFFASLIDNDVEALLPSG